LFRATPSFLTCLRNGQQSGEGARLLKQMLDDFKDIEAVSHN